VNAALLKQALADHQAGRLDAARAGYDAVLAIAPDHADAHYYLGMLHHQAGRHDDALRHVIQSVALAPDRAERFSDLGVVALAAGDRDQAISAFRQVVKFSPERADVWGALGDLLRDAGESADALRCYEAAVRAQPDFAEAQLNLGLLRLSAGDVAGALVAAKSSVRLRPDWPEAHNNLGNVFKASGDLDHAIDAYRKALKLRAEFPTAQNNLGIALLAAGSHEVAISTFNALLARNPGHTQARSNLADALRECGRMVEAETQYLEALRNDPDDIVALWNLGNLCWQQGRHADAAGWYARAHSVRPADAGLHSNLLYARLYDFSLSPEAQLAQHREYSQVHETPLAALRMPHGNESDPDRKLRIGYVSADFRIHPVAHFLLPILANHDKARFHVTAYANQSEEDTLTREIRACVDAWVPCLRMDDVTLAQRIRDDGIDILFDLSGHTAGNRLSVFARRPAPVQITYLSYPGTTGLAAMDYRLTDAIADPPGAEIGYAETLLRLPDSLCCYQPAPYMPELEAPAHVRNGFVTLASFNNYNKLTDECLALWARILVALPAARMLFAAMPEGAARADLQSRMAGLGISPDRLTMLGKLPGPGFVRAMQQADIALDPFPLTGGTTTMETLWMGLPTVVLEGDRFISRVGASFLTTAGMPAFIARTQDDYVKIVKELAQSPDQLVMCRSSMRERLRQSPLLDAPRFTRGLESTLREVWARWCAESANQP
jgi:protein O-GlcNAc transferase